MLGRWFSGQQNTSDMDPIFPFYGSELIHYHLNKPYKVKDAYPQKTIKKGISTHQAISFLTKFSFFAMAYRSPLCGRGFAILLLPCPSMMNTATIYLTCRKGPAFLGSSHHLIFYFWCAHPFNPGILFVISEFLTFKQAKIPKAGCALRDWLSCNFFVEAWLFSKSSLSYSVNEGSHGWVEAIWGITILCHLTSWKVHLFALRTEVTWHFLLFGGENEIDYFHLLQLLDSLFKECQRIGEIMVAQGLITLKDVEDAKSNKDSGSVISTGLPAYSLLLCLIRSANANSPGLLLGK